MGWTTYYDEVLPYVANEHSLVRGPGRQVDWASVSAGYGGDAFTVTLTATEAVDSTELAVEALAGPIPAGAVLYFGPDLFARVTAAAAAGDTTITVEAIPTEIPDGSEAVYDPGTRGKVIPAGTIMAELASGKIIPAADAGSETATHILESSAVEGDEVGGAGYGVLVGGAIFSNLLPDAGHADFADWLDELEAAGVGMGWHWSTYGDDTAS